MAEQIADPSFEQLGLDYVNSGGTESGYEFTPAAGASDYLDTASARTGDYVLRIQGDGAINLPRVRTGYFNVAPGDLVALAGFVWRVAGTDGTGQIRVLSYDAALGSETERVVIEPTGATATWLGDAKNWIVPAGVGFIRIEWRINLSPAGAADEFWWDDVTLNISSPGALRVVATGIIEVVGPDASVNQASTQVTVPTGLTYVPQVIGLVTLDDPPDFVGGYPVPWVAPGDPRKSGAAIASSDIIFLDAHGFFDGQRVRFTELVGGAGLTVGVTYYVIGASGTGFQVATQRGGTAVNITTDYSALSVVPADSGMILALIATLQALDNEDGTTEVVARVFAEDDESGVTFTFRYYLLAEGGFV